MLDINLFRNSIDVIIKSEKRRGKDPEVARKVLIYDEKWRSALKELENLRHERNVRSREIGELVKEGKDIGAERKKVKELNERIKKLEELARGYLKKRDEFRYRVGNILHESVPDGKSEEDNIAIRFWGRAKVWKGHEDWFLKQTEGKMEYEIIEEKPRSHVDVLPSLGLIDVERAAKVSGARFFYLKGKFVLLNLALQMFAIEKMVKKGFTPVYTPFMMKSRFMRGAAELADFEDMLYKVEGEDSFLIATAEQTLAAMHADEVLSVDELPKLYVGFSTNFRREAGAHGKDTKGIFRVHQFDKVEQYVFCKPEESWTWHERLIRNAEEIFMDLNLPYRVVNICAGEMNDNAAKKYDIEVWFPSQGKFREVVSCSNTTDYQARKLNVRFVDEHGEKKVVHTLNSTALATQRCLVAITENYLSGGVIKVPKVLRKYVGFDEIGA